MVSSSSSISLLAGVVSSNPIVVISLIDNGQSISYMKYIDSQNAVGLDQSLGTAKYFHINEFFSKFKSS